MLLLGTGGSSRLQRVSCDTTEVEVAPVAEGAKLPEGAEGTPPNQTQPLGSSEHLVVAGDYSLEELIHTEVDMCLEIEFSGHRAVWFSHAGQFLEAHGREHGLEVQLLDAAPSKL